MSIVYRFKKNALKEAPYDQVRHDELEIKLVTALFQPAIDAQWSTSFDPDWDYAKNIENYIYGNSEYPSLFLNEVESLAKFYNHGPYNPVLSAAIRSVGDVFRFSSMHMAQEHFTEDKHAKGTVTSIRRVLATTAIHFADGKADHWGKMYNIVDYERAAQSGLKALKRLRNEIAAKRGVKVESQAETEDLLEYLQL